MAGILGPRPAVVVRELSKLHEEFDRGTLEELADRYREGTRGEVTLLVHGAGTGKEGPEWTDAQLSGLIRALHSGQPLSASEIAGLLGLKRGQVYKRLLDEKTAPNQVDSSE
jgi:16S rRNA (cytidine1402-2'-O)-methyltransferase